MFKKQTFSFESTNLFNKLFLDYTSKHPDTLSLYTHFPDIEGYKALLSDPNLFKSLNRPTLVKAIHLQAETVSNTSESTFKNINLLEGTNSYTITTGHQLCLFTGPLYFIYKIISCINLSEWLKQNFPDKHFVPVYWMASEDHDFEEVNHAFAFGKKIEWQSNQKGAVGGFKTNELNTVITELEQVLGNNENSKQLVELFTKAYLENKNLADATRFIANALFGEYGLVVVDGNDNLLKTEFKPFLKKDVFENIPYKKVTETNLYLGSKKYTLQVNPREINCFILDENSRNRIEKKDNIYHVLNTNLSFTAEELEKRIDTHPEKISPNVVLRPLYQQFILPNIAYVGGPGELAYWLQYKAMFNELNIQFPILQPRKTILLVDLSVQQKLKKLNIPIASVFKTEKELIDELLAEKGSTINLDVEKSNLSILFNELAKKTALIDKTLENAVNAEGQKAQNSLSAIESKINKALKQQLDTELNQIKNIRAKLFPDNIPQERHENFSVFYSKWGDKFIAGLKNQMQGNDLNYIVLLED